MNWRQLSEIVNEVLRNVERKRKVKYTVEVVDADGVGTTATIAADTPNEAVVKAHETVVALHNLDQSITSGKLSNSDGHFGTVELTPK